MGKRMVVVVADHGLIRCEPIQLPQEVEEMIEHAPTLESRTPSFHVKRQEEEEDCLENRDVGKLSCALQKSPQLKENFAFLTKTELRNLELFGFNNWSVRTEDRIGDLTGITNGDFYLLHAANRSMNAHHGGMGFEEMRIPFIVATDEEEEEVEKTHISRIHKIREKVDFLEASLKANWQ